ncbi:MAG: hypothetical protein P4N60_14790 [Verrucomicrobiae bacterium]|nr:hypothetical protein [Verrucomicrobiae bacterium]
MKIPRNHPGRRHDSGMVTMLFIGLLAIMMILVLTESRALIHLHHETKFMEQQQIKRLNGTPATAIVTNTTAETK